MNLRIPIILAACTIAVLLSSCGSFNTALRQATPPTPAVHAIAPTDSYPEVGYSFWGAHQDFETPLRVQIDLSDQTATFFRGDTQVGQSRVATGRYGHSTPTGTFTIIEKVADKRSTLYGRIYDANGNVHRSDADSRKHSVPSGGKFVGAPMPNWMRLTGYGIGMHTGNIPNPGSPASHGCIRMPHEMSTILFAHVDVGTKVTIVH